jgi:hypothetical protein
LYFSKHDKIDQSLLGPPSIPSLILPDSFIKEGKRGDYWEIRNFTKSTAEAASGAYPSAPICI